jgi:hypothetical protein
MRELVIELPVPLPTWNRILGMNPWDRNKLYHLIHGYVSISTQYASGSLTQTAYQQKRLLMASLDAKYYMMIRPSSSKASPTRKKKAWKKKR